MRVPMARRSLLRSASALVVLGTLGGCGAGGSDGDSAGSIRYEFWGSPSRAKKVGTVVGLFQKARPGVQVQTRASDYNSYIENLTVRAAGGALPCALGVQSTFFAEYAEAGLLRPVDDLTGSGRIDVSGIPENVLASGRLDGAQYVIPTGSFVRILGYNADLVASSGAPAPADDMTWDDYATFLREVQRGLPAGVHASEIEGNNMFSLTSWVVGHGEAMFDGGRLGFPKSLLADWFRYWLRLTADGVTVPPSDLPTQTASLELTPLALGKAAIGTRDIPHLYITEQALAAKARGKTVAWVPMPRVAPARSGNVLGINGISIAANCGDVAATAAFVDFFTNDVNAALAFQSDNGIVTNLRAQEALLNDPRVPKGVKRSVTVWRALAGAGNLATTVYPAGLATLTNELTRLYESAAFGRMSVDEAVDTFYATAQYALA